MKCCKLFISYNFSVNSPKREASMKTSKYLNIIHIGRFCKGQARLVDVKKVECNILLAPFCSNFRWILIICLCLLLLSASKIAFVLLYKKYMHPFRQVHNYILFINHRQAQLIQFIDQQTKQTNVKLLWNPFKIESKL